MSSKHLFYKEEENKRKGIVISLIIHALLLLLFFIPLITPSVVYENGGILIAFGNPDAGMVNEIEETVQEKMNTQESSSNAASEKSKVDVVVSKEKEETSPVIATNKPQKPASPDVTKAQNSQDKSIKERQEKERKQAEDEKARIDKEAKEKAELAEKKKKYSDLLGKGKNNKAGNQGSENGSPDGKILDGISKGSGRVGGGLTGRGVEFEPTFSDNSQKTGKVALNICVNNAGQVSKADFTQKGSTTSDPYLIDLARKTAMKYRFAKSDIISQCGTVTIDFKVK